MEVVLLWLDELDDVVCALIQSAERLRWPSLGIGLAAACAVAVTSTGELLLDWLGVLTSVALVSVALWAVGAGARAAALLTKSTQRTIVRSSA